MTKKAKRHSVMTTGVVRPHQESGAPAPRAGRGLTNIPVDKPGSAAYRRLQEKQRTTAR